jgi:hypothetical protein
MACPPSFADAQSHARRPRWFSLAACAWSVLGLIGCSDEATGPKKNNPDAACTDGKSQKCACDEGESGKQLCEEGMWAECKCSSPVDAGNPPPRDASRDTGPISAALSLPCDVQTILKERCNNCHGTVRDFAAPMSMVTHADLMAPAPLTPKSKVYEELALRIRDEGSPMPPDGMLSEQEIRTLESWVEAGAKARASGDKCAAVDEPAPPKDAGPPPEEDPYKDLKGPEDCEQTFDFRAHDPSDKTKDFTVPAGSTLAGTADRYICFYFKPPWPGESQGLWFASMLDQPNTPILHHWLLYGTDAAVHADGAVAPCSAAEPGAYLLAGWAPGAADVTMPQDVGLSMPTGPTAGLILEVHYYNDTGKEVQDKTGMRLCTAKANTREHTAAVHFTGTEGICVPPGRKGFEVSGACNPKRGQGDIHILSVWPHMHKLGTHMKVTINRQNGTKELLHDKAFSFNKQIQYDKGDIILKPGDTMTTTCTYDNDNTTPVTFGEKTSDEMCFGFITAWPAGALAVDPATLDPIRNFGLGIQPTRRCLDPIGIFGACNGVFDYPL